MLVRGAVLKSGDHGSFSPIDSKLNTNTITHKEPKMAQGRRIGLLSPLLEKKGSAKRPKITRIGPENIT